MGGGGVIRLKAQPLAGGRCGGRSERTRRRREEACFVTAATAVARPREARERGQGRTLASGFSKTTRTTYLSLAGYSRRSAQARSPPIRGGWGSGRAEKAPRRRRDLDKVSRPEPSRQQPPPRLRPPARRCQRARLRRRAAGSWARRAPWEGAGLLAIHHLLDVEDPVCHERQHHLDPLPACTRRQRVLRCRGQRSGTRAPCTPVLAVNVLRAAHLLAP